MRLGSISAATGLFILLQVCAAGQDVSSLTAPTLIGPLDNAVIPQNRESSFCSQTGPGGFGFSIEFSWSPVQRAMFYEILVERNGSTAPMLHRVSEQPSYEHQQCRAFVVDDNLKGWNWRVRARSESGETGPWSEARHFEFAPCRLLNGTPCKAPAAADPDANSSGIAGVSDSQGGGRARRDSTPPSLTEKVDPEYTEEARQACLSGAVGVSLVVDEHGIPQEIRVVRPLGFGLDEKAVEAVSRWRFKPGLQGGKPIPVPAQVTVNFKIKCRQK